MPSKKPKRGIKGRTPRVSDRRHTMHNSETNAPDAACTLHPVVRLCLYCNDPIPKGHVRPYCSAECYEKMKRMKERIDGAQIRWNGTHYLTEWAWQVDKEFDPFYPGNIRVIVRGWHKRRYIHD